MAKLWWNSDKKRYTSDGIKEDPEDRFFYNSDGTTDTETSRGRVHPRKESDKDDKHDYPVGTIADVDQRKQT